MESMHSAPSFASPRDVPESSQWSPPCGHVTCDSDEWGDEYPDTASWLSDGGCSLEDRCVSSPPPARGLFGFLGPRYVDRASVQRGAYFTVKRASLIISFAALAIWCLLGVFLWLTSTR